MKATIEVKDRAEASALKIGLLDPTVRAFAVVIGILRQLPTDRARRRVLEQAIEVLGEGADADGAGG